MNARDARRREVDVFRALHLTRRLTAGRILLVVVATILLWLLYIPALLVSGAGTYHDDGIYLVTAKALAEGKGYRIISLPGEPLQTKYPPLFPAALAVVWRLYPDFPNNVPWLRIVPFAAFVGWLVVTYRLFLLSSLPKAVALAVVILVALSPDCLFFATSILSEMPFAFLSSLGVLLLVRLYNGTTHEWQYAGTAGGACAAAFLTRTIGLTLIVTGLAALAFQRRFRAAAIFAGVTIIPVAVWVLWCWVCAPDASLAYYSVDSYRSWHLFSRPFSDLALHVLGGNLLSALATPLSGFGAPINGLTFVLVVVLHLAAIVGFFKTSGIGMAKIWLTLYSAIVLCWVWPPFRFLIPMVPFWFCFAAKGLLNCGQPGSRVLSVILLVLGTCGGASCYRMIASGRMNDCLSTQGNQFSGWRDLVSAMRTVSRSEPQDAILAGNLDPVYYLLSSRKSVRSFQANPALLFYTMSGQPLGTVEEFERRLRETGASHIVSQEVAGFAESPHLQRLERELFQGRHRMFWVKTIEHGSCILYRRIPKQAAFVSDRASRARRFPDSDGFCATFRSPYADPLNIGRLLPLFRDFRQIVRPW